jgi:hypothetical protein
MKLITNKKVVRLPRAGSGVVRQLRNATVRACGEKWKRVIIIAESAEGTDVIWAGLDNIQFFGLMEQAKGMIE